MKLTIEEAIETLKEIKVCSECILEAPETRWRNVEGRIRKDIEAMRMAIDCLTIVGVCRAEAIELGNMWLEINEDCKDYRGGCGLGG